MMKKLAECVKETMRKTAQETAKNAVGRSVPRVFHEPKVPACLKKSTKTED